MGSPGFGTVVHVKNARARFKALNVCALQTIQPANQRIKIVLTDVCSSSMDAFKKMRLFLGIRAQLFSLHIHMYA